MAQLFICFAREDRSFAEKLKGAFEDTVNKVSGMTTHARPSFCTRVRDPIKAADTFILVVSHFTRPEVCNRELALATRLGKRLVAVIRSYSKAIPVSFDQSNCVPFHEGTDATFAESVERLSDVLVGQPVNFQTVAMEELQYIRARRGTNDGVDSTLIGLALSGGGIRSATTNLGMLQGLSRLGILPMVDYLNTVSGGGYIGSCLSALLSLNNKDLDEPDSATRSDFTKGEPLFTTAWANFPFREGRTERGQDASGDTRPGGLTGKAQVKHLRTHGNFVMARQGLFSRETMRGIGSLLTGIVYHLFIVLLAIFLISMVYMETAQWLVPSTSSTATKPGGANNQTSREQLKQYCKDRALWKNPKCLFFNRSRPALNEAMAFENKGDDRGAQKVLTSGTELTVIEFEKQTLQDGEIRNVVERTTEVTGPTFWYDLKQKGRKLGQSLGEAPFDPLLYGLGAGLLVALLSPVCVWVAFKFSFATVSKPKKGESEEDAFERSVLGWLIGGAVSVIVLLVILIRWWIGNQVEGLIWLFLPCTVFLGARAGTILAHMFPRWITHWWKREVRSLLGSFQALMTYGVLLSLGLALLPVVIYALAEHGTAASVAELVGAGFSLIATRLLVTRTPGADQQGAAAGFKAGLLNFALALAVAGFVLCIVLLFCSLVANHDLNPWPWLVVGGVLFGSMGWVVNFNKLALHYFYRDRLIETYLRTEVDNGRGRMVERHNAMEMPLTQLHGTRDGQSVWGSTAPYHLITTAINLAGSRDLTRKDRKSGYFLFSKLFCGSPQTGYRRTSSYRTGETKLARALTISGAAVSPGMGYHTFFAQAFATTLFNLRLGYWLENPNRDKSLERTETKTFWPRWLCKEMFSATSASDRLVNLSDGGHTGDNVGIYPLLQRRCKVIFACDAEADSNLRFGSFTEALRHAYLDEGIDVDIDLSMIRPDPDTGYSRKHCAIGRIRYPDRLEQDSWLIYLKSSLSGDEPEPVLNYAREHPSFPHETTADLFFDDAQFESYRALGVHIAESTFGDWLSQKNFGPLQASHYPNPRPHVPPPDEGEVWRRLQFLHSPFKAVDSEEFREMTDGLINLEQLFLKDPELKEYYEACYLAEPLPSDFEEEHVQAKLNQVCMIQTQLMEQVFFGLRLDRYANAPDNKGWMNLFRRWGGSKLFTSRFERIQDTFSADFVSFYKEFVEGRNPIEDERVPHPWDKGKKKGIFLDPGRISVSTRPL